MYERFERLLDITGKSIYQVSKDTGIPNSTLYEWKAGKYNPKADKLKILANYFGVSIDYFLNDKIEETENERNQNL